MEPSNKLQLSSEITKKSRFNPCLTVETYRAAERYNARERLPLIKCPALVLNPLGDRFADRAAGLLQLIPNGRLVDVESGNYIPRSDPEKFASAIIDFLQSLAV